MSGLLFATWLLNVVPRPEFVRQMTELLSGYWIDDTTLLRSR